MFELENNKIVPEAHILLIPEFKKIWEADNSKNKEKALNTFAYIYFLIDFKSPYRKSLSGIDLEIKVKGDLFTKTWKEDILIIEAKKKYEELVVNRVVGLYNDTQYPIDNIRKYFRNFDYTKLDEAKQAPAITAMMNNLQKVDELSSSLLKAQKRVEQEIIADKKSGKRTLSKRELPKNKR